MFQYIALILFSYLVGSIPFSYLTGKMMGNIDIRNYGSGNSGATNVLRTLGKKAGIIAFLGDFIKGLIITVFSKYLLGVNGAVVCSLFVVIGHCYPVWLGFKGGKGVATTGGTIFGLYPIIGIILFMIQVLLIKVTKIVSLSSIIVSILFPILSIIFKTPKAFVIYSAIVSIFVIYKHKSNIQRLMQGTESKIKFKG